MMLLQLRVWNNILRFSVQDYNLTDQIQQADEFTVFAPTDDAITEYLKKTDATALVQEMSKNPQSSRTL